MQAKSAITIADKYVLVRRLGTDATTELYLARRTDEKGAVSQVVVRRLLAELGSRKDLQEMFREEARVAAALSHPNILRVIEVGSGPDPFIAMEFIQGHSLARVQQAQAAKGSGIPPQHGLTIVLDVARGLHYAHERTDRRGMKLGILHRFLSPQKIVVGYDGVSRVIDFGVTRPWFRVDEADPAGALDRVRYLAPEQVKGQPVTPSSDIFSLGTILYELTTGRPPFDGATPQEVSRAIAEARPIPPTTFVPGYPEEMEQMVMQALQGAPDARFPSGGALAAALEVFLVRHEIQASSANVAAWLRGLFGSAAAGAPPAGGSAASAGARPVSASAATRISEPSVVEPSGLDLQLDSPDRTQTMEVPPDARGLLFDGHAGDPIPDLELAEITASKLIPLDEPPAAAPAAKGSRFLPAVAPPTGAVAPAKATGARAPWDAAPAAAPQARAAGPNGAAAGATASPASAPPVARPMPPAAATPAGPTPEELQLRERVTTLAKENALIRQELGPMREELAHLKPEHAATKAELQRVSARAGELETQAAKLTEDLAAVRAELARAKADAAAAAAAAAAKEIAATQKIEAATLREEEAKKEAAEANERESKSRRDLEVYKARDTAMRKELETVRAREAGAKDELEQFQVKESVLEKNADELRKAAESAKRDAEASKREAESARQEAETAKRAAQAKEESVQRQIDAIQKEATAKRDADVAAIEAATKRIVDEARSGAEKAAAEAKEATGKLDAALKEAEKAKLEANRLRHELEDAKAEIGVAQQALQAVLEENAQKSAVEVEAGKKVASAAEEAEAARTALQAARAEVEAAEKAAAAAREEAERAAKEAEAARAEKEAAETAKREAEERRRELESNDEEQAASRKAEVAAAMQVVRTAMQEADVARAEAEAAKADAEAAKRDAEAARADAVAALERAETARAEAEEARRDAEQTRAGAEKARLEALEARKAADAAQSEAEAAQTDAEEKKVEAARKIAEEREAAKRREVEAKQIEEAQIQVLSTAMRSVEQAKQEADEALAAAQAAKAEAESARREAESARTQADAIRAEAEAARREAEKAKAEAETARREAEAMRRDAEGARREAEAVRAVRPSPGVSVSEPVVEDTPAPVPTAPGLGAPPAVSARAGTAAPVPGVRVTVEEPSMRPPEHASLLSRYLAAVPPLSRSNLIAVPGAFVGRGEALRALEPLASGNVRQITLVGAPGSGRTRFARRFCSQHVGEFSRTGGIWFVDLAGATHGVSSVLAATAAATGIHVPPALDPVAAAEHVGSTLGARGKALVVLDGVDDAAREAVITVVDAWRGASKDLRMLLVADAALGIEGERLYDAGPLALPPADQAVDSEAGRLFVARAREQAREGNPPPPAGNEDVCRIVRLLRGHPLAIELIAARSEDFTIAALHTDLLEHLGGAQAPSDPRELLPLVLDWSWSRLATWEQEALVQASVFAGDFTADAAGAVIDLSAHADAPTIEEVLGELTAAALLRVRAGADSREADRYEMHPAVRAFATEQREHLEDGGGEAIGRHAQWALRAGRALLASRDTPAVIAADRRLGLFQRDLDLALERALAVSPPVPASAELALELVRCLEPVWTPRGLGAHGVARASAALEIAGEVSPLLVSEVRVVRGRLQRLAGHTAEAEADFQAARVAAAAAEDRRFEARILGELGLALRARGQGELARHSLDQALSLAKRAGEPRLEARLLSSLGDVARELGKFELARNCLDQAAPIAASLADKRLEAEALERLGAAHRELGALDEARRCLERALSLAPSTGNRTFDGRVLAALGDIALEQGRLAEARDFYKAALDPLVALGARREEGIVRGSQGVLEHLDGKLEEAKLRFAAASRIFDEIGDRALDAHYLAHLAALEAARGSADNAAAVFETARRRLREAGAPPPLAAATEVLSGFLDLARAKKADASTRKAQRESAAKKIPAKDAGAAARIAGKLLEKALESPGPGTGTGAAAR